MTRWVVHFTNHHGDVPGWLIVEAKDADAAKAKVMTMPVVRVEPYDSKVHKITKELT